MNRRLLILAFAATLIAVTAVAQTSTQSQPATATGQTNSAAGQSTQAAPAPQAQPGQQTQAPAQRPQAQQGAQGAQQGTTQGAAAVAPGPHPKSQEEQNALRSLAAEMQNPATPPDTVDKDVTAFLAKFPNTDYKEAISTYAMQFFQNRNDYPKVLQYGEQALKINPNSPSALVTLATAIPQRVRETDLDRDQRLAQAEEYDRRALQIADTLGPSLNGQQLTPERQESIKKMIRGSVHSSYAQIAYDRKDYSKAVGEFQQAIALDDPASSGPDYYRLAQAQEQLKQYSDAVASLDKALAVAPPNSALKTLASAERQKLQNAMGKPAASSPASAPKP